MAGKGDVTYEIRADDSRVEADLQQANKKVESAVQKSADKSVKIEEQKTKDIKSESDKIVKDAEKASENVSDAWEDAGTNAKSALSDIKVEDKEMDIQVDADTTLAEKNIDGLEADDMQIGVDADTGKAESEIENVSRDQSIDVEVDADTSTAEQGIEGLGDTAKETGEKIKESLSGDAIGNVGGLLKDSFSGAVEGSVPLIGKVGELTAGVSGASAVALGVGAAFVGAGALSVGAADSMKGAMNSFLSETGKSREETERYQKVLEDIYTGNYGQSFEDIASSMSQVTKNMGDMDDASLQNVTESAITLRDTFGYDIPESTRAAKAMMDNFGVSGEDAMGLIAAGAQNGLDYSGELMDSISEYSVQFEKVGLGADDMFKIFEKGAETGAWNLDKIGDAVKEMSIRVVDGSDTTREGFELIGLNADEMAAKFGEGGEVAKEAFNQTIEALAGIEDPLAQNTAGVDLFGTMWEDLGPEVVSQLASIEDGAYSTGEELNAIKDIKYDDLGSMFEELKRNVELLLIPIGEALIPLLSMLIESVLPVITELLGPLISQFAALLGPIISLISSAIQPLIQAFINLITTAIQPLIPIINSLVGVFTAVMSSISGTVTSVIGNVTNIFRGLIDFIKNVFTGNWSAAWQNIKDIFSNIVSGLAAIFKAPINAIVDGWNSLAASIGGISIPDWVPGVGGKSLNLPRMSRLKIGMDYVPNDLFPAWLDEGEMVLTKENASLVRALGGVDGIMAALEGSNQKNINVSVQNSGNIDYDKMADAQVEALIRARVGFKCGEREFAYLIKELNDYV